MTRLNPTLLGAALVAALLALPAPGGATPYGQTPTTHHPGVNAVVGDASAEAAGVDPASLDRSERLRLHLAWVEQVLRARDTSHLTPPQRAARERQLDALRSYWIAGAFPHNDGHADQRRPTFIDEDGDICAVGHLIAVEWGREVAEGIAQEFKYGYVHHIDAPALEAFSDHSGLSVEELSMIQPSYDHIEPPIFPRPPVRPHPPRPPIEPPPRPPIVVRPPQDPGVDRAFEVLEDQVNACVAKHLYEDGGYPEPWLPVTVRWGADGKVSELDFQLPAEADRIDGCVREAAPRMSISGGKRVMFRLVRVQSVG